MKTRNSALIIIAATIVVYLNSLANGFVWDDIALTVNNDFIKGFALIKEIIARPLYYLSGDSLVYYRPLQAVSYLFDYSLWGLVPFGFHLTNLVLHILAALLVYRFSGLLFGDSEAGFLSALLFAVHPLNTSVVDYISGRADILLAVFSLSALLLFIRGGRKYYFWSLWCFILALLSKEAAVIFPLVLVFVQEMYFKIKSIKEGRNKARPWYAVFILASLIYLLLRIKVIKIGTNIFPPAGSNPASIIFTFINININYIRLAYAPFGLHMLRNIPVVMPHAAAFILYGLFVLILSSAAIIIYRRNKRVFLLLGLSFLWLLPTALPFFRYPEYYLQGRAIMAESWFYLPLIGILAITVWLLKIITARARLSFYIVIGCLAVYFSIITVKESFSWRSNYALFSNILKYVDNSVTAYRNIAQVYLNRGANQRAIEAYRKALLLKQDDKRRAALYNGIARAFLADNRLADAYDSCKMAIAANPDDADSYTSWGLISAVKGDPVGARQQWRTALDRDPFNAAAFDNLVRVSASDKETRKYLIDKYEELLGKREFSIAYRARRALGIIYFYCNIDSEAVSYFKKALAINPYDAKASSGLAVCFARSADCRAAVKFFRRSIKLNPFDPEAYRNLALLYKDLNMPRQSARLILKAGSLGLFE